MPELPNAPGQALTVRWPLARLAFLAHAAKMAGMYPGERFNAWSHLVGAVFALTGATWLIITASLRADAQAITSVAIYGTAMVLLYAISTALLHKSEGRRDYPSPRRSYAMAPTGTVLGRPSCVKRLSRATRTCNSTTCRSNVRAITRWPRRLKQCILVSTRLLR